MDISVTLPLDSDGFLRRQCPHCDQQFKWHNGPANEEAESHGNPTTYYCPLCGEPAGSDQWWTEDQLDYIKGNALPAIFGDLQDQLAQAFSGSKNMSITPGDDRPDVPAALTEPDDMRIVASPCHAFEPIKVLANETAPLHCLLCGAEFSV